MEANKKRLDDIYKKTDGHCRYCHKKLVRNNYGKLRGKGRWQIDHSKPESRGGTDHLNNLFASCPRCNNEKGDKTSREYRMLKEKELRRRVIWYDEKAWR